MSSAISVTVDQAKQDLVKKYKGGAVALVPLIIEIRTLAKIKHKMYEDIARKLELLQRLEALSDVGKT